MCVSLVAATLPHLLAAAAPAPPRVIILMLGDDYGYNNVGFSHGPKGPNYGHGNPEMRTPHMDALARSGIVLDRFYAYKCECPTILVLHTTRLRIAPTVLETGDPVMHTCLFCCGNAKGAAAPVAPWH